MRQGLVILAVIICFVAAWTRPPAMAAFNPAEMFKLANRRFTFAMFTVGSRRFSAPAYYLYKNSPAERAKGYRGNLGQGDWHVAAYSGISLLAAVD
jgi:hypothetical protein